MEGINQVEHGGPEIEKWSNRVAKTAMACRRTESWNRLMVNGKRGRARPYTYHTAEIVGLVCPHRFHSPAHRQFLSQPA
jgi:hypothetical protein